MQSNGISIIVELSFIEDSGIAPTMDEIKNHMLSLGFTLSKGKGINAEYTKDGCLVTDIRLENLLMALLGGLSNPTFFSFYC